MRKDRSLELEVEEVEMRGREVGERTRFWDKFECVVEAE